MAEAHLVEYRFCIFSKSLMSILNLFHTKFGVRVNQVSNEEKLIKDISHFEVASIVFAGYSIWLISMPEAILKIIFWNPELKLTANIHFLLLKLKHATRKFLAHATNRA